VVRFQRVGGVERLREFIQNRRTSIIVVGGLVFVGLLGCCLIGVYLVTPEQPSQEKRDTAAVITEATATLLATQDSRWAALNHAILTYFPLYEGTSWTYSYVSQTASELETRLVTETVTAVPTSISGRVHLAEIAVSGRSVLDYCGENYVEDVGSSYWMVSDQSRAFVVCSRRDAYFLASDLARGRNRGTAEVRGDLPEYVFPLQEGEIWQEFTGDPVSLDDPSYQWHVGAKLGVRVPAGTFTDCYRIELFTLPDETMKWVCPGVGLVAVEYSHHGALWEYRAELVSYTVGSED